jgi:hypothetical protein
LTIRGIIKSDRLSIEINSRELLIETPTSELWIGRGASDVYPGINPGTSEGYRGSLTTARYFSGLFIITTRMVGSPEIAAHQAT